MPIDWEKFQRDLEPELEKAEKRTDERLAGRIASVTRLTEEEVREMFPEQADVEKLARLMTIVGSAEDRNRKLTHLTENIEELGGVVLTLLGKLV